MDTYGGPGARPWPKTGGGARVPGPWARGRTEHDVDRLGVTPTTINVDKLGVTPTTTINVDKVGVTPTTTIKVQSTEEQQPY